MTINFLQIAGKFNGTGANLEFAARWLNKQMGVTTEPIIIEDYPVKFREIEYVKVLVDEIYQGQLFYSLSLHTLELTRRFNNIYKAFQEERSPSLFHQLMVISGNLEQRLQNEEL